MRILLNYRTYISDHENHCSKALRILIKHRFTERGGKLEQCHVESLEELAGHYNIVCNCSGLGAKELCQDSTVTSIRGQVFKVCGHVKSLLIHTYSSDHKQVNALMYYFLFTANHIVRFSPYEDKESDM